MATSGSSTQTRVILITGSTSGIGLAIAKKFAASQQYEIILNGFTTDQQLAEIQNELKSLNGGKESLYVSADLRKQDEVEKLVKEIINKYPTGIDVLVNNAGTSSAPNYFTDTPVEDFDQDYALMARTPFLLCKAFVPLMKKYKEFGRIINIASINSLAAAAGMCHGYIAAKHAILGLTRSLSIEVARDKITVNAVCPGAVDTPFAVRATGEASKVTGISVEELYKRRDEVIPMKRGGEPDEIAEAVWFAASPGASFMTGSTLVVDGGQMAL